jgi:hypothetical protein
MMGKIQREDTENAEDGVAHTPDFRPGTPASHNSDAISNRHQVR